MTLIDPRTPKQEAGPPRPADGKALTSTLRVGETSPKDAGTDVHAAPAA